MELALGAITLLVLILREFFEYRRREREKDEEAYEAMLRKEALVTEIISKTREIVRQESIHAGNAWDRADHELK